MSRTPETVHMVYGLLATGSKVTSGLIKPESVSAISGYLSQKLPQGEWDGEPKRGSNIKEEHVWWALLRVNSTKVIRLLARFGSVERAVFNSPSFSGEV